MALLTSFPGGAPSRWRRRRSELWLLLAAWFLSGGFALLAQTAPSRENQIKAVFLFQLCAVRRMGPLKPFLKARTPPGQLACSGMNPVWPVFWMKDCGAGKKVK